MDSPVVSMSGREDATMETEPIRKISSREVYRNPWCSVREDVIERRVSGSDVGVRGIYGVMDKEPACIVIALESTAEGEFVWLVRQFRYSVGAAYFEFPQGSWEIAEVDALELARGELAEETGLRAERMTRLASPWVAYGAMRQVQHVFLAEGLSQGDTERDPEEHDMTVHRVGVGEFEEMVMDGRVRDNCTLGAWGVYQVWRRRARGADLP
jgi:8-oxo-dGTP pyrophosphatase MutT (NUDIX family)